MLHYDLKCRLLDPNEIVYVMLGLTWHARCSILARKLHSDPHALQIPFHRRHMSYDLMRTNQTRHPFKQEMIDKRDCLHVSNQGLGQWHSQGKGHQGANAARKEGRKMY